MRHAGATGRLQSLTLRPSDILCTSQREVVCVHSLSQDMCLQCSEALQRVASVDRFCACCVFRKPYQGDEVVVLVHRPPGHCSMKAFYRHLRLFLTLSLLLCGDAQAPGTEKILPRMPHGPNVSITRPVCIPITLMIVCVGDTLWCTSS